MFAKIKAARKGKLTFYIMYILKVCKNSYKRIKML